jgi:hypothetical protein
VQGVIVCIQDEKIDANDFLESYRQFIGDARFNSLPAEVDAFQEKLT